MNISFSGCIEQSERRSKKRFSDLFLRLSNRYLDGKDISDPNWEPPEQISPVKAVSWDRLAKANKLKTVIKRRKIEDCNEKNEEISKNLELDKMINMTKPCSVVLHKISLSGDAESSADSGVDLTTSESYKALSTVPDNSSKVIILSKRLPARHELESAHSPKKMKKASSQCSPNTDSDENKNLGCSWTNTDTSERKDTSQADAALRDYLLGDESKSLEVLFNSSCSKEPCEKENVTQCLPSISQVATIDFIPEDAESELHFTLETDGGTSTNSADVLKISTIHKEAITGHGGHDNPTPHSSAGSTDVQNLQKKTKRSFVMDETEKVAQKPSSLKQAGGHLSKQAGGTLSRNSRFLVQNGLTFSGTRTYRSTSGALQCTFMHSPVGCSIKFKRFGAQDKV